MNDPSTPPPAIGLARWIREFAEGLTDRWIETLRQRLSVRPMRLLPSDTLRDHIPTVLAGIADMLESLGLHPSEEIVQILRNLTDLRRKQGYDIQEILAEFGSLADLLFEVATEWGRETSVGGEDALQVATRLSQAIRAIVAVTVGTYQEGRLADDRAQSRRLGDFASLLCHEVRNPLHALSLNSDLLAREGAAPDPARRLDAVERIRRQISRIEGTLENLLSLAAIGESGGPVCWSPVTAVVDTVVGELREASDRYEVDVRLRPPVVDVEVDEVRTEIALVNLVSNAIKFSDPGKDVRRVEVRAERARSADACLIVVEDNGLGIPAAAHGRVFARFYRGHHAIEGTGLGLNITKSIVEQAGGRLWFESEPGRGTIFYLEMPARPAGG